MESKIQILPKSVDNYLSVQEGCLRFLDSYRFLSSSLDKLVRNENEFPILDSFGWSDELLKQKLAYPYEHFTSRNLHQKLQLKKEGYWSTLTQSFVSDKDIERTNSIIKKYKLTNGQQLTMLYLKLGVLLLADVIENFVKTCTEKYTNSPLYSYSLPDYTSKVGLKNN